MATTPDLSLIDDILRKAVAPTMSPGVRQADAPRETADGMNRAYQTAPRVATEGDKVPAFSQAPNPEFMAALQQSLGTMEKSMPEPEEGGFFGPFFQVIDFLAQPFYGIRNLQVNAVRGLRGDKATTDAWTAFSSGFALDPNKRVRNTMSDVLREAGVGEGPKVDLPIIGEVSARDAVGLIVDIFDPTDPMNKLKLFSKTGKGMKMQKLWLEEASKKLALAIPKGASKAEKASLAKKFLQEFVGNADKKALLRTMGQEAAEGHRSLVQIWGFDPLPNAFNAKVFEAFGKASKKLGHLPVVGELFKNRPLKRVLSQFVSEAEAMRNAAQGRNFERMIQLEKMMRKLPKEQQDMVAPALERLISFRRIIGQGLEEGLSTNEIVQRLHKHVPQVQAKLYQEGKSLEQIYEAVRFDIRDRLGQLTVAELPGINLKNLPEGILPTTSLDEYWAIRTARQGAEESFDQLTEALTNRVFKPGKKRIRDQYMRDQVARRAREFNRLSRKYSGILNVDPNQGGKAWMTKLGIENSAVEKAGNLHRLKSLINEGLDGVHNVNLDDLRNFPGRELTIDGQRYVTEFAGGGVTPAEMQELQQLQRRVAQNINEPGAVHNRIEELQRKIQKAINGEDAGEVILRNADTDEVRFASEFVDSDGIIRQDIQGGPRNIADDEIFAGKLAEHLDEISGLSPRAARFKDDRLFSKIDEAIEKTAIDGKMSPERRMAAEIAQKRAARETLAEGARNKINADKYAPDSAEHYLVNQTYFDAIKVTPDSNSGLGTRSFELKAPDGTTIGYERVPLPKEAERIVTALEDDLLRIRGEELSADLLDDFMEGYSPRFVRPDMLQALEELTRSFGGQTFKKYRQWLGSSQHRTIRTMTQEEFNLLNRTGNTKFSDIYTPRQRKKIYQLFSRMDPELGDFFDQRNPVLNVLRRANASSRAISNKEFTQNALNFFSREMGTSFQVSRVDSGEVIRELSRRRKAGEDVALYVDGRALDKVLGGQSQSAKAAAEAAEAGKYVPPRAVEEIGEGQLMAVAGKGKKLRVHILPREVVSEMNKVHRIMNTPESMAAIAKSYRYFLSLWKGYALMGPGYHSRNAGSGLIMNAAADVNPLNYKEALKYVWRKRNPEAFKGFLKTAGGDVPEAQVAEWIENLGIAGNNIFGAEMAEALQSQLNRPSLNPLRRNFLGLRANRMVGEKIEDHLRVAHFLDVLKKTGNPFEAQRSVNKYLFNYNKDLPHWERALTNVVPFWRWTRNNIPAAARIFITNPGFMRKIGVAKAALEQREDRLFPKRLVPNFIRDGLGVQMRTNKDGSTEFFLIKNWVPVAEIDDVFKWISGTEDTSQFQEVIKSAVERVGPLKMPIELFATEGGFSTFFRREIERFPGETAPFLGGRVTKKALEPLRSIRPLNDLDKLNPFNVFGQDRPGKVELPQSSRWWNYATGGRLHKADLDKAYQEAIRVRRRKINDYKLSLRYILKRPPAERRARADEIRRLREMIREEFDEIRRTKKPRSG